MEKGVIKKRESSGEVAVAKGAKKTRKAKRN